MSGQTSTMNGQKNGQTRSTNRQRSSASGSTSIRSTTIGQENTTKDQASCANTASNKTGFAIIIILC